MKTYILEFIRRGLIACGFGPMVLAILYGLLYRQGLIQTLTVEQVCLGIFSLSGLAFIAGGTNIIYQIERLPLMPAIFIHGTILYLSYLAVYLINSWLPWGIQPILIFTGIFVFSYFVIWLIIYTTIKRKTTRINLLLQQKQQETT